MEIRAAQFRKHLERDPLAAVYILAGDEPLQKKEAGDLLRTRACEQGFEERHTFVMDSAKSDWQPVLAATQSMSLFAQRQLIEIKMLIQRPGDEGRSVLQSLAENLSPDNIIVLSMPRLDASLKKTAWFKALSNAGALLQFWPVSSQELPGWINRRIQAAGVTADKAACSILAERSEGNLLAADQEIEKLVLTGHTHITAEVVLESVLDSARFDIFALTDSLLANEAGRYRQILRSLQQSGTPAAVVKWVLAREIRTVIGVASGKVQKLPPARMSTIRGALKRRSIQEWQSDMLRLTRIDAQVKGQETGSPWSAMLDIGVKTSLQNGIL